MSKVVSDRVRVFKSWVLKLVLSLVLLLPGSIANAQYIYNDCYASGDLGDRKQERFVIRPLGEVCYQRCESECRSFSRLSGGNELNQGVMDACRVACRSGQPFSSKIEGSSEEFQIKSYCPAGSTSVASVGYNIYNTQIRVAPKRIIPATQDKKEKVVGWVRIKLLAPSGSDSNVIYLCGSSTVSIKPSPAYLKNALWKPSDKNQNIWNARNNKYYDTTIDVKDGDYISILYGGQYRTCGKQNCPPLIIDKGLFIKRPTELSTANVSVGSSLILPAAQLQSLKVKIDPNKTINEGGMSYDNPESMQVNNSKIEFYGLGNASIIEKPTDFGGGLDFKGQDSVFNGDTTVFNRDAYYSFTGQLKGFSKSYTTLAIAHPDYTNNWDQHLGGYNVSITRKGCQFLNGQRLQYAIAPLNGSSDQKSPTYSAPQTWYDVTEANVERYEDINIPVEGLLYLRIKPLEYEAAATPQCQQNDIKCANTISRTKLLYTPGRSDGQYYVLVEQDDGSNAAGIISSVVGKMRGFLFGEGGKKEGIVQTLFNRFVTDSGLISSVQALLVFYIAYTGLSFILGIAQFTQKEGAIRLVKIGIVIALISPGSWHFFNNHLFKIFTDGALELLVLLTATPDKSPSQVAELLKDPTLIFDVFNEPFKILFGKVTWIKIASLIFAGPLGIIIGLVIAVSGVIYAICIAKATLLYLVSLVGIATLLLMAPIFISFVLFQFTRQIFDTWLKQLMCFVFQPIMVYVFIVIINYLILAALQVVLGFTACKSCWFALELPALDPICIIPGYVSLFGVHNPDGIIGMPMSSIAAAFYFLILAQAMYAFTSFGALLAILIVMGSFRGINLSDSVGTAISSTQSMASTIIGIDQGAVQGTRDVAQRAAWVGDKYGKTRDLLFGKKEDDDKKKKP